MSPINLSSLIGTWNPFIIGACVVISLVARSLYLSNSKTKFPFPPGPKGSLIIGNLRQIPAERSDIQFAKWAKEYKSDILYLNLLGQPLIVLNSVQSATDLLEKRKAIYSDRPPFVAMEALGFTDSPGLTPDNAQYRKLRKAYGGLSPGNSLPYRQHQLNHARQMAIDIENYPGKWQNCLSQFATRVIFSIAFAIDIKDGDDPYFHLAEGMGWILGNMGTNGITALDIAPWLQHAPRWIGKHMASVKYIQDHSPLIQEFHQRPFDEAMKNFRAGKVQSSIIGRLIEARENRKGGTDEALKNLSDGEIKGTGGGLYAAGADTTFTSETVFVMAMLLAPHVQTKAQQEVDAVTGGTRMPTFDDMKSLPIVERIVHEIFRFHPPVPNGIPHRTLKEDVYNNMYIPKVIANAWAMAHDTDIYKDPFTFNPDRFLPVAEGGADEPFPQGHFGFGRRVCPGQYVGFASVWIVVATLLAKFDISPPKDADGKDIMPVLEFSTGITSLPIPFRAILAPRNGL